MTIRNPSAMLIAGTLAGAMSGLMHLSFAMRGAGFGLVLTWTILMVRRQGWRPWSLLPGLLLGAALGLFPFKLDDVGIGRHLTFDHLSVVNAALFIPLYTFAYLQPRLSARLGYLLLVGVCSAALRTFTFGLGPSDWLPILGFCFGVGTLPFLALWLAAMFLTDPLRPSWRLKATNNMA